MLNEGPCEKKTSALVWNFFYKEKGFFFSTETRTARLQLHSSCSKIFELVSCQSSRTTNVTSVLIYLIYLMLFLKVNMFSMK